MPPIKATDFLHVIGIGASVGGLEAMHDLLPNLPKTGRISYIYAQHMAIDGQSELIGRLLSQVSPMEIVLAQHNDKLRPDIIHMLPAGFDGCIRNGTIQLMPPGAGNLSRPSINTLFASLADAYGPRAIAILLSGAGSDGAAGCRAIRARHGRTIAQNPASAKFYGMPSAAIEAGVIQQVMHADEIAGEISRLVPGLAPPASAATKPPTNPPAAEVPRELQQLERLLTLVHGTTGVDFSGYKVETLLRRLHRRIGNSGFASLDVYLHHLLDNRAELKLLQELFLVSVSSFFRDQSAFAAASEALADIVQHKAANEGIRIWVPGCASGEEVYTLAILLAEILGDKLAAQSIEIIGSDLNEDALNTAKTGTYRASSFKEMPPLLRQRYFSADAQGYSVSSELRRLCRFIKHDVVQDPPQERLDMISCRNLLIYMKISLQIELIDRFHRNLLPHGLLFIGESESLTPQSAARFSAINHQYKVYRRR